MLMDSTDAEFQQKTLFAISQNIGDFSRIAMLMRLKLGFRYSNTKIQCAAKLEEVGGSVVHFFFWGGGGHSDRCAEHTACTVCIYTT
jgi:hypothetical protein